MTSFRLFYVRKSTHNDFYVYTSVLLYITWLYNISEGKDDVSSLIFNNEKGSMINEKEKRLDDDIYAAGYEGT